METVKEYNWQKNGGRDKSKRFNPILNGDQRQPHRGNDHIHAQKRNRAIERAKSKGEPFAPRKPPANRKPRTAKSP